MLAANLDRNRDSCRQQSNEAPFRLQFPLDPCGSLGFAGFAGITEKRSNGKTVFSSPGKEEQLKVKAESGYWKFVSAPEAETNKAQPDAFTDAAAKAKTHSLFAEFGLPKEQIGRSVAVGVGEADKGIDGTVINPHVTARHVRVYRQVNGIPVWGSHVKATYTLTGKPFRVEVRWPSFSLRKEDAVSHREKAVGEIAAAIAERRNADKQIGKMKTRLVYWYNEEDDVFEPTLIINVPGIDEEMAPDFFRYSLTKGMITPPSKPGQDL